jgi:hypothetical protein
MTKRILKRHKRQVARAKQRVRLSEPDLRTPEEINAAKTASRPVAGRHNDPLPHYAARPGQNDVTAPREGAKKTDA